jgi:acyl dehydratase
VAWKDTRWPKAVRAGDRLRAKWECVAKRESSSDPRRGVIEMDYRLTDQSGDTVFSCRSVNLIERRR